MPRFALVAALGFIGLLAFLTLYVLLSSGPDLLDVVSLFVLALFFVDVIGALATRPEGEE